MTETILITGANRGIGLEYVNQYAANGDNVIACCRQPNKADQLQALAKKYSNIRIEGLDVLDQQSITALAAKLNDTAIDILINNAGIYSGAAGGGSSQQADKSQEFGTLDAAAWDHVLKTNSIAPIMVTQAFVAHVARSQSRKIIMTSSRMGSIAAASAGAIAYRTSKAALNGAMHNIAKTLAAQKIIVISFHPGWVKTDMGGGNADIDTATSVNGMRSVIAKLTLKQSGEFLDYTGKQIPW